MNTLIEKSLLFTIDGLLLLAFIIGWLVARRASSYRLVWWRIVRAISWPLATSMFSHLMPTFIWWFISYTNLSEPGMWWLANPLGAIVYGAFVILAVPFGMIVVTQSVMFEFAPLPDGTQ